MRGVIDVFVGQIKRDDLAAICVKTNMQFAPGAAFRSSMFFEQPFAGSAQFQPGAVNNQLQVARSNPRPFGNRQSARPSAQRRMTGRSISNIRMIEPINPSLWRSANRNTARNVRAVSMARSE